MKYSVVYYDPEVAISAIPSIQDYDKNSLALAVIHADEINIEDDTERYVVRNNETDTLI